MFEPISFKDLSEYSDGNSVVMMDVIFNEDPEEIEQFNEWLHEIKLIPDNSHVTDLRHIVENVLGERGRSDYLICFTECLPSPTVRLQYGADFKWTSDFISNYKEDYKLSSLYEYYGSKMKTEIHNHYNVLQEAYHVNTTFYKCINDIEKLIKTSDKTYFYTGWCYDNANDECVQIKNEDTIVGHPIYINVINDENADYFSVKDNKDKSGNEPIIISFNIAYDSPESIRYALAHEFQHTLEMFVKNDLNFLKNDNYFYIYDDKAFNLLKDNNLKNKILRYCYLLSLGEQRARINSVIKYCLDTKPKMINKSKPQFIASILFETEELTYLQEMQMENMWLEMDLSNEKYERLFYLGYFLKMYGDDPAKRDIKVSYNMLANLCNYDKYALYKEAKTIYDIVNKNIMNFYKKLVDNISTNYILKNIQ